MNMDEEIIEIFNISQKTKEVHQKNAIRLEGLYRKEPDDFWESLQKRINVILTSEQYTDFVHKIIEFFAQFCSILKITDESVEDEEEEHENHALLRTILMYLLQASENKIDNVRLRSLQIINKILEHLEEIELSDELCEEFQKFLLPRLKDSISVIREKAVMCLHCFQNPLLKQDITNQLIHLMQTDCQAKVRELAVEKIMLLNKNVIKCVILRINDVNVRVKLAAYKRLSSIPKFIKISERRQILQSAFVDDFQEIKKVLKDVLISSWLECYDNNILKFLKALRLDADEGDIELTLKIFEKVLDIIFRWKTFDEVKIYLNLDENNLIPPDDLDWELLSFWRILLEFLHLHNFEDKLSEVQPELFHLCGFIKKICHLVPEEITPEDFLRQGFILKQLFVMTKLYDYSDLSRRHCLNNLVKHVIMKPTLTSDLTETIISTLEYSIPNTDERTFFVNEIISDILYPVDEALLLEKQRNKDYQIARLKVKLGELKQSQIESIQEQNFTKAQELKEQIDETHNELQSLVDESLHMNREEKKTDVRTISKCLDITIGLLLSPHVTSLTPSLISIKNDFVQNLLMTDNDTIRIRAFKCFALFGNINKEVAVTAIHILITPIFAYQSGEECGMETLLLCIGAVVDLLRIYGPHLIAVCENNGDKLSESMEENHQKVFTGGLSLTDIVQELVQLMNDEEPAIQEKAVLGLCQLMLSDRIFSPSITAHLVLKWCNPASDDESSVIKQTIGFTLGEMMLLSRCQEQFEDAVFIVLNSLFSPPENSPLLDVVPEDIAKFLFALGRTSPKAEEIHFNLAIKLFCNLKKHPENDINSLYSKIVLYLQIPQNEEKVNELIQLCDHICSNDSYPSGVITDISKFKKLLKNNLDMQENLCDIQEV